MPEGDASLSPVVSVLRDLGSEAATGCLAIRRPDGLVSHLYLADGRLYAADAPGERPTLGTRLVTYGVVSSLDVFQALDRQWAERGRWQLGEVLVHLERAEADAVAPHVRALLVDTVADALAQEAEAWQVREGAEARGDVGDPVDVDALVDELADRAAAWEELSGLLGGPFVTVRLVEPPARTDDLDAGETAVLDRLAPQSTLPAIALDTGLTLLEVAQSVRRLAEDGVVTVVEPPAEPVVPPVAPDTDAYADLDLDLRTAPVPPATPVAEADRDEADRDEAGAVVAHEAAEESPVDPDPTDPGVEREAATPDEAPETTASDETPETEAPQTEAPDTEALDTAALLRELASLGTDVPAGDDAERESETATGRGGHGRG